MTTHLTCFYELQESIAKYAYKGENNHRLESLMSYLWVGSESIPGTEHMKTWQKVTWFEK